MIYQGMQTSPVIMAQGTVRRLNVGVGEVGSGSRLTPFTPSILQKLHFKL